MSSATLGTRSHTMKRRKPSKPLRRIVRALAGALALAMLGCVTLVFALRWVDPPTSAFMLRERILAARNDGHPPIRHRWVGSRIAPVMKVAVIAAEDQRFLEHRGFDLESIQAAFDERARGGRVRGASTISQQLAKNLFLWPGRSWVRKALEAGFTVLIESFWPKQRILEVYLNVVEFGPGIYGVGTAADHYFGKPAAELTAEEAALLAAVLPNPRRLRAAAPSAYVRSRQQWILAQMRSLGGTSLLQHPQ